MRAIVARELGLELSDDADEVLAGALAQRIAERKTTATAYLDALSAPDTKAPDASAPDASAPDATELHTLGQLLTVGETYFFRMRGHFEALRALATEREGAPIAVLSAGCSTGEEAYSIAMTLLSIGRSDARVTAIDLSRRSLEAARAALYSEWALRAVAPPDRDRWFTRKGRAWEVRADVRAMVDLRAANLIDADAIPLGPFDAVFCRNVTMYFTRDAARTVIARLTASLKRGGLLFLGHAETLRGLSEEYAVEACAGSFHYRHTGGAAVAPSPPTVRTATPPKWMAPLPPEPLAAVSPDVVALVAEERFKEALAAIAPGPSVLRAVALLGDGEVDAAEEVCAHLVATEEGGPEAHYVLGLAAEHRGDRPAAIDRHRAALYLEPDFALAHLQLGRLARREGDAAAARRDLRHALDLIAHETATRIALLGGGFDRDALLALTRAELAAIDTEERKA
ncbi:MAG: methyltransferase domain-containing protein [Labilithrix sp.]|nr:methyltransferase domain-containing protein [Labilithrix sp.]MCW5815425.1 methyltransferase domain-containing protein [Labilithrix sp.]